MPRGRVAAAGLGGLRGDSGAGLELAAGGGGLNDYEDYDTYGVVNDPRKNFVSLCLNNICDLAYGVCSLISKKLVREHF